MLKDLSMVQPCIAASGAWSGYEGVVQSRTRLRSGLKNMSSPRVTMLFVIQRVRNGSKQLNSGFTSILLYILYILYISCETSSLAEHPLHYDVIMYVSDLTMHKIHTIEILSRWHKTIKCAQCNYHTRINADAFIFTFCLSKIFNTNQIDQNYLFANYARRAQVVRRHLNMTS